MTAFAESDALHARVLAFARATASGHAPAESFDMLALELARFQARQVPGFRRLVDARRSSLDTVQSIPAVPVDAFRLTRVATYPEEADVARFTTSGTTGAAPGVHVMRTTHTYRELSVLWGRPALTSGEGGAVVVALAPEPGPRPTSSLGFMMREFMARFDGRALAPGEAFDARAPARWLASPSGVDVPGLEHAAAAALRRGEPLVVLATSFALVLLLDALSGRAIDAPERTVVMTTGGFKGKTREIASAELVRDVAAAFRVPEAHVVGEYGMTELTSQLYEHTVPGAALRGERGVFLPPPWLRVTPVHPESLEPVAVGDVGIARFVDLGNVDSAVAIVTQDLVRVRGDGIELLGRRTGAPLRGCSLAVEEMVLGAGAP